MQPMQRLDVLLGNQAKRIPFCEVQRAYLQFYPKNLRFFLDRIGKDSPGVGNCASGATGGVLGEMSALAYKKEHAGTMTQAELRERAGNRAAMIGAVSGAVVGEGWVY